MIITEPLTYTDSQKNFKGYICFDDAKSEIKPGVLIVHTIRGCTDFEVGKAADLAELGYFCFAVDMYGDGKHSQNSDEARPWMNELNNDRTLLLKRIWLAFEILKKHPQVDESKLGAIGYCFGGKCVLDLARSGANVNGVVSFHGVYDKPPMAYETKIKSSILVLHGWDDPLNPIPQTIELAQELTSRNADWQLVAFGKTGHSFTNPMAQSPEQGLVYNELSNKRAWLSMQNFFEEKFNS